MLLKGTPFHSRTAPLMQGLNNWRRWSGYNVASCYELYPEREYWAIRNSAALLDITPLYKYLITGPDALRLINRVVTRDVTKCAVRQVMYTPWCDDAGKVVDDGTVSRLEEQVFRVTSAEPSLRWFAENAPGLRVKIEDVTDSLAALALQGPSSRTLLQKIADLNLDQLKYFRLATARLSGIPATISRTGYTGDLGYEIWLEPQYAERLWDVLIDVGAPYGLTPTGILALDLARVEAGLIMLDVDYTSARAATIEAQKSSPFELGLGWAVSLKKDNFVGRRALVAEQARPPAWRLVGVEVEWESLERLYNDVGLPPQLPTTTTRVSVPIFSGGRQIGYASSSCWSPVLKKYIALAHLEASHATPDTLVFMEVTVEHQRKWAAARVAKTPFFDPERKKT